MLAEPKITVLVEGFTFDLSKSFVENIARYVAAFESNVINQNSLPGAIGSLLNNVQYSVEQKLHVLQNFLDSKKLFPASNGEAASVSPVAAEDESADPSVAGEKGSDEQSDSLKASLIEKRDALLKPFKEKEKEEAAAREKQLLMMRTLQILSRHISEKALVMQETLKKESAFLKRKADFREKFTELQLLEDEADFDLAAAHKAVNAYANDLANSQEHSLEERLGFIRELKKLSYLSTSLSVAGSVMAKVGSIWNEVPVVVDQLPNAAQHSTTVLNNLQHLEDLLVKISSQQDCGVVARVCQMPIHP